MPFQIIRSAAEAWDIFCIDELWHGTHEYEIIARVFKEGELYYIEYAKWDDKGKTFVKQPRGYQLPKGAFRAVTESQKQIPEKPKS